MAKRMILMLVVLAALLGGLGFAKFKQVEAAIAQGASFQPPPTAVTTVVAGKERLAFYSFGDRYRRCDSGRDRQCRLAGNDRQDSF